MKNIAFYVAKTEEDAGIWVGFSHEELSYDGCLREWSARDFSKSFTISKCDDPDDISPELITLPLHKLVCQLSK